MVGVDGSRKVLQLVDKTSHTLTRRNIGQSYEAVDITARLRRQGSIIIVNVDEELAPSRQMPHIPSKFLTDGALLVIC